MAVPLLVFLHGLGQTPQTWQEQVTALPAGTRAVAPWLEGCRPGSRTRFEVDAAADAVMAQLNRFGVDQVALCGDGLGAVVASVAAIRCPDAVSHLVLQGGFVRVPRLTAAISRLTLLRGAHPDAGIDRAKLRELLDALFAVDLGKRLGAITASTLVIAGERDRAGGGAAAHLAGGIPTARLTTVPGAGSQPHREQPAAFNAALYGFLDP